MTYEEQVERNLRGLEAVSTGGSISDCGECSDNCSGECGQGDGAEVCYCDDEGSFSSQSCDACGSNLGGDRYVGHGLADETIVHLEVCTDCVLYLAYGEVPNGN